MPFAKWTTLVSKNLQNTAPQGWVLGRFCKKQSSYNAQCNPMLAFVGRSKCTCNFTCSFHLLEFYVHVYMYSNAAARLYSQYMPCVHLNDLRTNTCALVSRRALGTVGHVQWSVKVWERWQIVKLKDVTAVLNFTKREDMVVSQDSCVLRRFASCYSPLLYSSFLMWTSWGYGCIYILCLLFHFRTSLLVLPFSQASEFLSFWCHDNEIASTATKENDTLMWLYTTFCKQDILIAFLSGYVCTQATPLIAFLKWDEVGAIPCQSRTHSARLVAMCLGASQLKAARTCNYIQDTN